MGGKAYTMNIILKCSPIFLLLGLIGCTGAQVKSNFAASIANKPQYRLASASDSILADAIGSELLQYGFVVVERSRLSAVLDELKLNMNGVLLPENLKKVGRILNVDALFFTTAYFDANFGSKIGTASVKLVDVESGELLGGINYQNGSGCAAGSPCDSGMKESMPDTAAKIAKEIAIGLKKASHPQANSSTVPRMNNFGH